MLSEEIDSAQRLVKTDDQVDPKLSLARQLWETMFQSMPPFPNGVVEVPQAISGTAFFPGGLGVWMEEQDCPTAFSTGQIMIVGQDFNTSTTYQGIRERGTGVDLSTTWLNLRKVLANADISLRRCFFTNFYMGLRDGGGETRTFPGKRDKAFVRRCEEFFQVQLQVIRPRLILTLGLAPLRALAAVAGLPRPVTLSSCTDFYPMVPLIHGSTAIVALTHPSLYHLNVGGRKYGTTDGAAAEQGMIRAGLSVAFGEPETHHS